MTLPLHEMGSLLQPLLFLVDPSLTLIKMLLSLLKFLLSLLKMLSMLSFAEPLPFLPLMLLTNDLTLSLIHI